MSKLEDEILNELMGIPAYPHIQDKAIPCRHYKVDLGTARNCIIVARLIDKGLVTLYKCNVSWAYPSYILVARMNENLLANVPDSYVMRKEEIL